MCHARRQVLEDIEHGDAGIADAKLPEPSIRIDGDDFGELQSLLEYGSALSSTMTNQTDPTSKSLPIYGRHY